MLFGAGGPSPRADALPFLVEKSSFSPVFPKQASDLASGSCAPFSEHRVSSPAGPSLFSFHSSLVSFLFVHLTRPLVIPSDVRRARKSTGSFSSFFLGTNGRPYYFKCSSFRARVRFAAIALKTSGRNLLSSLFPIRCTRRFCHAPFISGGLLLGRTYTASCVLVSTCTFLFFSFYENCYHSLVKWPWPFSLPRVSFPFFGDPFLFLRFFLRAWPLFSACSVNRPMRGFHTVLALCLFLTLTSVGVGLFLIEDARRAAFFLVFEMVWMCSVSLSHPRVIDLGRHAFPGLL